jgi:hypothetical protein
MDGGSAAGLDDLRSESEIAAPSALALIAPGIALLAISRRRR